MSGFTVTRRGITSSHLAPSSPKARTFETYGEAEAYLGGQIERLRSAGYQSIEYRRTMEQHRAELINDTAKTDVIWSIRARRGIRRGRGIIFTMRPTTEST